MEFALQNAWCATLKTAVQLNIGYFPFEKKAPQEVLVEVKIWAGAQKIQPPFVLEKILDYDKLLNAVQSLENQPHTDFLEEHIWHLMRFFFQNAGVDAAWVKMEKTQVYQAMARPSVDLFLTREHWEHLKK